MTTDDLHDAPSSTSARPATVASTASAASISTPAPTINDPNDKSTIVGGVIITPSIRRAMTLPDDDPQVIAASAPPPPASAWERNELTSPQERYDAAVAARAAAK